MLSCALIFFGIVVFILGAVVFAPAAQLKALALPGVALFGSAAAFSLRTFGRVRDSVAVNSEGIWYLPQKDDSTFIAWRDVASVKAHDTRQRLVLIDATNGRSIRLEYQLEDFGRLRDFVLRHAAAPTWRNSAASNIFHRTWINKVVLLGFAGLSLFLAGLGNHQGQPVSSLFFVGLAVLLLWAITQDPVSVAITPEAVVVKYPGRERTVPFHAISRIALTDVYNRGNVWAGVIIERPRGKPIKLFRFREGSVALQDALQSAWHLAGGGIESARP